MEPYVEIVQFPGKLDHKGPIEEGPFDRKQLQLMFREARDVWTGQFGVAFGATELGELGEALDWASGAGRCDVVPKLEAQAFRPWTTLVGEVVPCVMVGGTAGTGSSVALACSSDGRVFGLRFAAAGHTDSLLFVGCAPADAK
jgi:hypothetical protein